MFMQTKIIYCSDDPTKVLWKYIIYKAAVESDRMNSSYFLTGDEISTITYKIHTKFVLNNDRKCFMKPMN